MAQENIFAEFKTATPQRVPLSEIKPVIAAPRDPYEADKEARAQDAAVIQQQQAAIAARGEERQTGQQAFQRVAELRKEFNSLPEVK
ncbi:hypothetical protein ACI3PL_22865, partial [Lacticaseibacillus paracasei]